MEIEIRIDQYSPQALIVHLKGSLDTMTDPRFRQKMIEQMEGGVKHLLLQMSGVKYLSSTGLGVIIDLKKRIETKGGSLMLFEPQLSVKRVLEIVKLEKWEVSLENIQAGHPFFDYIKKRTDDRQKQEVLRQQEEAKKKKQL